jgi:histidine ammonia-lyase
MRSIIVLTGQGLSIEHFVDVARNKVRVALDASIHERALASRETLDRMLERNEVIYGVNIGFGGNVKFLIPPSAIAVHQQGMLRHLYCGAGPALSTDVVRGAMLLRANALAKGCSAVRPIVLDRLIELLNADIVPIVPR